MSSIVDARLAVGLALPVCLDCTTASLLPFPDPETMQYSGVTYGGARETITVAQGGFRESAPSAQFRTFEIVALAGGGRVVVWDGNFGGGGFSGGVSGGYISWTSSGARGWVSDAFGELVRPLPQTLQARDIRVAASADGGFATASFVTGSLRLERFSESGISLSTVESVIQTGFQGSPAIAARAQGGFVVAWADNAAGSSDIRFQMFASDGSTSGDQRLAHAASPTPQNDPVVAALSGGGFVVAWRDAETQTSDAISMVRFQRYDSSGVAIGDVRTANPAYGGPLSNPDISPLASGGFVVTWSVSQDFRGQVFDAAGAPVGSEFGAFATSGLETNAAVQALGSGGFVVVWQDNASGSEGVFARVYDDAGGPLGPQFRVAPAAGALTTAAAGALPTVTSLPDGSLEFAWIERTGLQVNIEILRIGLDWVAEYSGTDGTDVLIGSPIDDTLAPGAGVDQVRGGAGSDTVSYAGAGMAVEVDLASRWSWDGTSMDFFQSIENAIGSAFNDVLTGDGFNNTLDGGSAGTDHLRGGGGLDTVSFASSLTGVSVDLALQVSWDGITMDFLQSIENATGSAFNDVLVGDSGDNVIDGGTGGIDFLFGGGGSDTVSYVSATAGVQIYLSNQVGWDGTSMDSYDSIENATGSGFADWIEGSSGDNLLAGGGGDDRIDGGLGTDTLVLGGLRNQYAFTDLGGGLFRSTDSGWARDGVDTFSGIELVRFADGSIISLGDLIAGAASAEAKELAPLVLPPRWAEPEDVDTALLPAPNPPWDTSVIFTTEDVGENPPADETRWNDSDWHFW